MNSTGSAVSASGVAQTANQMARPKLLNQVRIVLRGRHYSQRTESAYLNWIKRFILFHNKRHPAEMAETEVNQFLTHLAINEKVSASTQNQALSALLFLYRHVLDRKIGQLGTVIRARKSKRLPVVLTRDEVRAVFNELHGEQRLIAVLMYGTGMRCWSVYDCELKTSTLAPVKSSFARARAIKIGIPSYRKS
jgi:site-specific recombinase XerD